MARTKQHVALYIANGHGAWEAANTNMFSPGDAALCLITGRFGEGWANAAAGVGCRGAAHRFRPPASRSIRIRSGRRCAPTPAGRIKAVLMTHVDTTTSVRNDVAAVRAAIDDGGTPRAAGRRRRRIARPAIVSRWTPGVSTSWSAPARKA